MATQSAIAVTLFLGGPAGPLPPFVPELIGGLFWFLAKVTLFLLGYIWLRAALPRLRYDQLMDLAWKIGIPAGLLWLAVSAVYRVAQDQNWPAWVYIAAPLGGFAVFFGVLWPCMPNRPGAGGPASIPSVDRRTGDGRPMRRSHEPLGRVHRHPPPGAVRSPGHHRVSRGQAAQAHPLPRPPHPEPLRGRDGEVHRLRAVRRCLPRPVHLRPGRRQPTRRAGLSGRALRVRLRDQLPALHPLRPLRRGLPDRGHHRDEALRVLLHQSRRDAIYTKDELLVDDERPGPADAVGALGRRRGRAVQRLGAGHRPQR